MNIKAILEVLLDHMREAAKEEDYKTALIFLEAYKLVKHYDNEPTPH